MDASSWHLVLLFICIVLGAFFSCTETALTSLSRAKTQQLIESNGRFTKALHLWLHKPNRVLTALLFGDNLVNTLCAAVATVMALEFFGDYAVSIATGVVTIIVLVFGEITPKTFAKYNAAAIAPFCITLLVPFYWLTYPITIVISKITTEILRLFGSAAHHVEPIATEEDIAFLIRLGYKEGVLEAESGEMLDSVIEFRDTMVKEAMNPRTEICSFDKDATFEEVAKTIAAEGHSRWPVYHKNVDNIIGIFHTKDMLMMKKDEREAFSLKKYLRQPLFVPETMKLSTLLKEFKRGRTHLAVVVDEYGGTAGVISLEDVLEELVGEIRDEYDDAESETMVRKVGENSFLIDGRVNVHELEEVLNIQFPQSDRYDSLGGFLIDQIGKVPKTKQQIEFSNWTFTIQEGDKKRINKVLAQKNVSKIPSENDSIASE